MGEFDMHSFCKDCGAFRTRMPFGRSDSFFDRGPCSKCGGWGGNRVVSRNVRVGRWPWQRGWIDRDGVRVDVPVKEES